MTEAKLYVFPKKLCRTILPAVFVKRYNITSIELVEVNLDSDEFSEEFPWKKVPVLLRGDNEKLTEAMAINKYLIELSNNEVEINQLLGNNKDIWSKCQIIRWESFANSDFLTELNNYIKPLIGWAPYNEENIKIADERVSIMLHIFEEELKKSKYLTGESLTLADLTAATCFSFGFTFVFDKEWRIKYPHITNWFNDVINSDILKEAFHGFQLVEVAQKLK